MEKLIQEFKNQIIESCKNPDFLHHEWYVKYHLDLVERISLELCEIYKDADKNIVLTLVWSHDYAKILNREKEHDVSMFEKTKEKLLELGFEIDFINTILEYLDIFEKKMEIDLNQAPIEVKIVSSADAAAHLVGPFWNIYYKEFNNKSIEELMQDNRNKLKKDWERKIVLPEIKKAFEDRNRFVNEQAGNFPNKFL